jgi:endonuclease III
MLTLPTAMPLRDDLMVQQQLPATDLWVRAWQHMVAVIMLNQTGRRPVKMVLPVFLHLWPVPGLFLMADQDQVRQILTPLGMYNVRSNRLRRIYERCIDVMYKHLMEAYQPDRIRLEIEFRPRGGISSRMTVDSDWGHLGGTDQLWQHHR